MIESIPFFAGLYVPRQGIPDSYGILVWRPLKNHFTPTIYDVIALSTNTL
jgi:hypothetical protein